MSESRDLTPVDRDTEDAPAKRVFNIDPARKAWNEFHARHMRMAADKKWTDSFKEQLKDVMGDADSIELDQVKVATLIPGQLNRSLLAREQPDIIKRFTRPVVKEEFDTEAFEHEEPELFKQYQVRRLVLTTGDPEFKGFE